MSSRRQVRERVMQALYAYESGGGEADQIIQNVLRPSLEDDATSLRFAESLFLRTLDLAKDIDEIIGKHLQNWDFERVAMLDRILLRIAICEFLAFDDIPPKVSMNEAIEVAKRYSTPKSGKFINGILDAVLIELQQEGRLKKSGRGLIGTQTMRGRSVS